MRNRLRGLGNRFQGKIKSLFSNSLTPSTYTRAPVSRGFSLIEMVVAVALFAVIMLVAIGALLSLVDANRKARALESVMNNLNISLDSLVRSIRMGTTYHCGSNIIPSAPDWGDCVNGVEPNTGTPAVLSFAPFGSDATEQGERWVYFFENGRIYRSKDGSFDGAIAVTAPEVSIDEMQYYVIGTVPGDIVQPKVVIVVKGSAGAQNSKTHTTFYIQATSVQRSLDI